MGPTAAEDQQEMVATYLVVCGGKAMHVNKRRGGRAAMADGASRELGSGATTVIDSVGVPRQRGRSVRVQSGRSRAGRQAGRGGREAAVKATAHRLPGCTHHRNRMASATPARGHAYGPVSPKRAARSVARTSPPRSP